MVGIIKMDSLSTYSTITCNFKTHTNLTNKKRHDWTEGLSKRKNQKEFYYSHQKLVIKDKEGPWKYVRLKNTKEI